MKSRPSIQRKSPSRRRLLRKGENSSANLEKNTMCHCLLFIVPPVLVLIFWVAFAAILWPLQVRSAKSTDKGDDQHSDHIYKDFEFFIKVFLAIAGGLGYMRIEKFEAHEHLIRQGMEFLGGVGLCVAGVFGIFIITHQGSKLRRWSRPPNPAAIEWGKMPLWQENWMCLSMLAFATALWGAAIFW